MCKRTAVLSFALTASLHFAQQIPPSSGKHLHAGTPLRLLGSIGKAVESACRRPPVFSNNSEKSGFLLLFVLL